MGSVKLRTIIVVQTNPKSLDNYYAKEGYRQCKNNKCLLIKNLWDLRQHVIMGVLAARIKILIYAFQ